MPLDWFVNISRTIPNCERKPTIFGPRGGARGGEPAWAATR
jgi:hypothetical protein